MIRSMRRVGTILLAFAVLMTAAGCGKKNKALTEKQLTELLPDTITTYSMDDAQHVQEVESLKVIKRNMDEDTDFVECEIVLKDDSVQRTVYADLYLTYYETGGWLIDGWSPYAEETAVPLTVPDGEEARQIAVTMYPEAVWMEDDTSMLEQGVWRSTFEINEEHRFADFQGTLTVKGTFSGSSATSEGMAVYDWGVLLDSHDVHAGSVLDTDPSRIGGIRLLSDHPQALIRVRRRCGSRRRCGCGSRRRCGRRNGFRRLDGYRRARNLHRRDFGQPYISLLFRSRGGRNRHGLSLGNRNVDASRRAARKPRGSSYSTDDHHCLFHF